MGHRFDKQKTSDKRAEQMRRKFDKKDIDIHPDKLYPWRCACGEAGCRNISETNYPIAKMNPYPCVKCYGEMMDEMNEKIKAKYGKKK